MSDVKMQVIIDAQNKANGVFNEVSGQMSDLKNKLDEMKPVFQGMLVAGTAAFAGIAALGGVALKTFIEDEKDLTLATGILENALSNMATEDLGYVAEGATTTAEALEQLKENMENAGNQAIQLGYDDEAASVSFAKLFATTNDVAQAQSDLQLAMDLAAYSGRDLETTTQALIKAHSGETRMLKEFGIVAEEGATAADVLALAQERVGGTAEKMAGTAAVQLQILALQWDNVKAAVGGAIAEALVPVMEKLTPIIDKIIEWAEANPKLIATIMAVVAGGALLVAGIGAIGLIMTTVTTVVGILSTAVAVLGTVFTILSGPIGIVIAIIGLLIAAGVALYTHWDAVKEFALSIWESIKAGLSAALNAMVNIVKTVGQAISDAFWFYIDFWVGLFTMFLDFLFPGWQAAFQAIWDFTLAVFEGIKGAISFALTWIKDTLIIPYLNAISLVWSTIWNGIKDAFTTIWDAIKSVASGAFTMIQDGIETLTAPLEWLIGLAEKAYNMAKKLASVGVDFVSGASDAGSSYTGHAFGGPVGTNRPGWVGERGPELFWPNSAGRIIPQNAMGGGGIHITLTGNTFVGKEDIAEQIGNDIMDIVKQNVKINV